MNLSFATFWAGPQISALDAACLHSYAVRGYPIKVYSFGEIGNLPEGVSLEDARQIDPQVSVDRFLYEGKANLSHYSDFFRYQLFSQTEDIWVDMDMLLLANVDQILGSTILARERNDSICGSIMRLGKEYSTVNRSLIERCESLMDRDLIWGETGPLALTKFMRTSGELAKSMAPDQFFPISHDDFWKMFLPDYRDECTSLCHQSCGVHLWNNIIDRFGFWKDMAPPKDSFLSDRFQADGSLSYFKDVYPVRVMRQMVENWRFRQGGGALGIGSVGRQMLPSIKRSIVHRVGVRNRFR